MKLNAEAMRPRTELVWQGVLYRVLSNDTLKRRLILENVDDDRDTRPLNYEPGTLFECVSAPHYRSI